MRRRKEGDPGAFKRELRANNAKTLENLSREIAEVRLQLYGSQEGKPSIEEQRAAIQARADALGVSPGFGETAGSQYRCGQCRGWGHNRRAHRRSK